MTKDNLIAGVGGLVLGIVLTIVVTPLWGGMMGGGSFMMGQNNKMGNNMQMSQTIDSHFIEQMIPHHEDAILMANIALEKATHPEIKQLAQDIKRSQGEEIEKMRKWYREWYGKEVPDVNASTDHGMGSGMMHGGMMGNSSDIEKLKTAQDFDKVFIDNMIPHHQMAVMMTQMLAGSTDRPEMKQLAQDISQAQTKEINSMRTWYGQWYGQ